MCTAKNTNSFRLNWPQWGKCKREKEQENIEAGSKVEADRGMTEKNTQHMIEQEEK